MADFLKYGNAIRLAQLSADPSSPENGLMYYNTSNNVIRQYINGGWQDVASGSVALTGQDLNENEIIVGDSSDLSAAIDTSVNGDILADETNGLNIKAGVIIDADINAAAAIDASKIADGSVSSTEFQYLAGTTSTIQDQLDDKLNLSGGTMTGTITSQNIVPVTAATYTVGASGNNYLGVYTNTVFTGTVNKGIAGDLIIQTAAAGNGIIIQTAAGNVKINPSTHVIDASSALISNVLDPVGDQDAATKNYVDDQISGLPNPITYVGTWDADTNTPTLDNTDTGVTGFLYYVNVAGTVDFGAGPISFEIGDKVVNNGTSWDKWDNTDAVLSVNGQTGVVVLDTGDISENGNLYFTDERAQDAVGGIFDDTASVELVYADATPLITANVIPGGVDHDQLLNFVANEHVDHTSVQIATAANTSGLSGGGTIAATRNLVVDINGTTAETVPDNADKILIYDNSATALKSMTRANFLSGIAISSPGDLNEGSFAGLADNTADQVITGFAFNNAIVRSFKAQVSIAIDATSDLFAVYELMGIQRGADWQMSESFTGDSIPSFSFNITSAGQVRVTIGTVTGFSSAVIKFRALTTSL